MKILKVNDNYRINIEHIYLLEKSTNEKDINNWKENYSYYLNTFINNPPEFADENEIIKISFNEKNDPEIVQKYQQKLDEYIKSIIGECPEYYETYYVLLTSGLKIQIGKYLYERIEDILDEYII